MYSQLEEINNKREKLKQKIRNFNELLLFNDKDFLKDYNYLREDHIDNRPEPYTLYRITFNIKRWTTYDFDNLVSDSELIDIIEKVESVVYNWMFSNPSSLSYVSETPYRFGRLQPKSFLDLEYELMQSLTHAVSAYLGKDSVPFTHIIEELGLPTDTIRKLLTSGVSSASVRDLLRAKTVIVSYILDPSMTEQKLYYYDHALNKIDEYLATRHLRLFEEKFVSKKGYDKQLWDYDKIKAYHIISLLCRDLGFDPLTFKPLDPEIFDKNLATGLYARHHLDIRRKFSVYLQDLLLTGNSHHRIYDTQIPVDDQKILVKIIQDLIQNDGSGSNKEITAKDIVKAFLNNFEDHNTAKFYLENYWQSRDFQENLKDFNDRKSLIKQGQYEALIKNKYKDAYNRFFNDAMNILNSLSSLSDYRGYKLSRVFSIADIDYLKRIFNI